MVQFIIVSFLSSFAHKDIVLVNHKENHTLFDSPQEVLSILKSHNLPYFIRGSSHTHQRIFCYFGGYREPVKGNDIKTQRNKVSAKSDCPWRLNIYRQKNQKWAIGKFEFEHAHPHDARVLVSFCFNEYYSDMFFLSEVTKGH